MDYSQGGDSKDKQRNSFQPSKDVYNPRLSNIQPNIYPNSSIIGNNYPLSSGIGLGAKGIIQGSLVSSQFGPSSQLQQSIRGESQFEYIPKERVEIEYVPQQRVDYIPVEKKYTDYQVIEHQTEYVPQSKFETYVDYHPVVSTEYEQIKTIEYVPVEKIQNVPRQRTDYVPVERVEEKIDYQPVTKQIQHQMPVGGNLKSSIISGQNLGLSQVQGISSPPKIINNSVGPQILQSGIMGGLAQSNYIGNNQFGQQSLYNNQYRSQNNPLTKESFVQKLTGPEKKK